MNFKEINPKDLDIKSIYHLLISGVSPRPIALVGSIDKRGNSNLAPFSFFNAFGANPPIIGFSPALSGKTGIPNDTLLNIKDIPQFTDHCFTGDYPVKPIDSNDKDFMDSQLSFMKSKS